MGGPAPIPPDSPGRWDGVGGATRMGRGWLARGPAQRLEIHPQSWIRPNLQRPDVSKTFSLGQPPFPKASQCLWVTPQPKNQQVRK